MIYTFNGSQPKIHDSAFIAPNAVVLGDVEIGENSSIWFGCAIRGDVHAIRIGANCNIQDMTMVHVSRNKFSTTIENNVSIGHCALIHGCHLQKNSFVGMRATIMDGVEIGEYSIVGAGSLVTPGKKIPPGVVVMGSPAKIVRDINEKDRALIENTYKNYANYKANYQNPEIFNPKP
ncbi:MAG: gamma carbonic anhydrase family protein [Spirochaetota bacterium]